MPTLVSEDPDSYDIDYYHGKYKDRHGVGLSEAKPQSLRVLPADINPTNCDISKKHHYFKVSQQPIIATCFCRTYHTSFTFRFYRIPHSTSLGQSTTQTTSTISTNRFRKISDELPQSPIPKQQLSDSSSSKPRMLFPNFQIDPTPTAIVAHSQHYHTCLLCGIKNIPCVATEQSSHAPDYTICTIFKQNLIHRLCVPGLLDIKLKPLDQTSPLTFQQQIVTASIKSKLIGLNTQTSSSISPLTLKQQLILALIKIQRMKSKEKIQLFKSFLSKKNKKGKGKVNQRDTTNDLD